MTNQLIFKGLRAVFWVVIAAASFLGLWGTFDDPLYVFILFVVLIVPATVTFSTLVDPNVKKDLRKFKRSIKDSYKQKNAHLRSR